MQPDQTGSEIPEPTFATAPGVESINSIYAYDCGDEEDHLSLKGESLDGSEPDQNWWQGNEETGEQL